MSSDYESATHDKACIAHSYSIYLLQILTVFSLKMIVLIVCSADNNNMASPLHHND